MVKSRLLMSSPKLSALGALLLLISGCGAQASTLRANPSASPSPAPTVSAADCRVLMQEAALAHPFPPLAYEFRRLPAGAAIVVARLAAPGKSRYATPGNTRPSDGSVAIFTPWSLEVSETWRGHLAGATVALYGGSVGCDSVSPYTDYGFGSGRTFLIVAVASDFAGTGGALKVFGAWPVDGGDVLVPQSPSRVDSGLNATARDVLIQNMGPASPLHVPGSAVPLSLLRTYVLGLTA